MTTPQQELVNIFNALPRPQTGGLGLPNHYHFSIQTLPLLPGEALFLVNPHNNHEHTEGRTLITTLPSTQQAKIIVPLLLYSFNARFDDDGFIYQFADDMLPRAPWSWSISDPVLASAVSARLREIGVRAELREVSISEPEHVEVADEKWAKNKRELAAAISFVPADQFVGIVEKSCNACGFTPSLDTVFKCCPRCKRAYYCSRGCKREDWREHKKDCTSA